MSLAITVQAMVASGCTPEQIAAVAAAHDAEAEKEEARKRKLNAVRQKRFRERHPEAVTQSNVTKRHETLRNVTPPKQKDAFPPTPPLLEKLIPPLSDADASLVGVPADVNEINAIAKRKKTVELLQTVVGMWNELATACRLVAVRDITATRQAAIIARSDDLVKTYDFPDPLAGWRRLMGLVRGSPFLRGELNGFRCDFDFVVRASSFTKIMEGKYEARAAPRR